MLQMEDPTTTLYEDVVAFEEDAAFERKFGALIDAERDAEQLSAFDFAFDNALAGNDAAELIGVPVAVVEIRFDGEERRGLVARVIRGNAEYTVSLLDLHFVDADLPMLNLLGDYRNWVAQR